MKTEGQSNSRQCLSMWTSLPKVAREICDRDGKHSAAVSFPRDRGGIIVAVQVAVTVKQTAP